MCAKKKETNFPTAPHTNHQTNERPMNEAEAEKKKTQYIHELVGRRRKADRDQNAQQKEVKEGRGRWVVGGRRRKGLDLESKWGGMRRPAVSTRESSLSFFRFGNTSSSPPQARGGGHYASHLK